MDTYGRFRDWFWRPPRAHGEIVRDRVVSPVELLYDLVYVVVISQAAHSLAVEVDPVRIAEFAIVFGMIWVGWVNGSLYLDLHGREDGRTRSFVFIQMGILALVAVFAGEAAHEDGPAFAIAYAVFLGVLTWLWISVRRRDAPEFMRVTKAYAVGMVISTGVILISAFLPREARLAIWVLYSAGWIGWIGGLGYLTQELQRGITPTRSTVERFGLFTIIVLGEVVFGVVTGISSAERDALTIATGIVSLGIGLGFWWIYFDIIGGRFPRHQGRPMANWIVSHFPITLSIAAAGAGVASLIGHAHEFTDARADRVADQRVRRSRHAGNDPRVPLIGRCRAPAGSLSTIGRRPGHGRARGARSWLPEARAMDLRAVNRGDPDRSLASRCALVHPRRRVAAAGVRRARSRPVVANQKSRPHCCERLPLDR